MNRFALFSFFLILFSNIQAQDRIVSIHHDTIYCSITSINNERILYELQNKDGSITGKFINLSQVAEYTRSPQSGIKRNVLKMKTLKQADAPENFWCLSLNVGRSTMPWYFDNLESTNEMPDYYEKIKTGFHINTSAHYMIKSFLGMGAEYSFFNKSFKGDYSTEYSNSFFLTISEKYREYISYVGPSVLLVQHLDAQRKFILSESFSVGALFMRLESQGTYPNFNNFGYTDEVTNSLISGSSLSAKFGLSAQYRLLQNVSVGLCGDFLWASLKKASYKLKGSNNTSSSTDNQKLSNALNLSRIDYSLVLRYQF